MMISFSLKLPTQAGARSIDVEIYDECTFSPDALIAHTSVPITESLLTKVHRVKHEYNFHLRSLRVRWLTTGGHCLDKRAKRRKDFST